MTATRTGSRPAQPVAAAGATSGRARALMAARRLTVMVHLPRVDTFDPPQRMWAQRGDTIGVVGDHQDGPVTELVGDPPYRGVARWMSVPVFYDDGPHNLISGEGSGQRHP